MSHDCQVRLLSDKETIVVELDNMPIGKAKRLEQELRRNELLPSFWSNSPDTWVQLLAAHLYVHLGAQLVNTPVEIDELIGTGFKFAVCEGSGSLVKSRIEEFLSLSYFNISVNRQVMRGS